VLREAVDLRAVQMSEEGMNAKQRPLIERLAQSRLVAWSLSHGKPAGEFPEQYQESRLLASNSLRRTTSARQWFGSKI
jgi:hypothetical protein